VSARPIWSRNGYEAASGLEQIVTRIFRRASPFHARPGINGFILL